MCYITYSHHYIIIPLMPKFSQFGQWERPFLRGASILFTWPQRSFLFSFSDILCYSLRLRLSSICTNLKKYIWVGVLLACASMYHLCARRGRWILLQMVVDHCVGAEDGTQATLSHRTSLPHCTIFCLACIVLVKSRFKKIKSTSSVLNYETSCTKLQVPVIS